MSPRIWRSNNDIGVFSFILSRAPCPRSSMDERRRAKAEDARSIRVVDAKPQRVGEPGRPYLPWKQGIGGSNPPTLTIFQDGLQSLGYPRKIAPTLANVSVSCPRRSMAGRCALNAETVVRFHAGVPTLVRCRERLSARLQSGEGRFNSDSDLHASVVQWMGAGLLIRSMQVRILSEAPICSRSSIG